MSKGKSYSLFLNSENMAKIDQLCKKFNRSKSSYIDEIIEAHVKNLDSLFPNFELDNVASQSAFITNGLKLLNNLNNQMAELIDLSKDIIENKKASNGNR